VWPRGIGYEPIALAATGPRAYWARNRVLRVVVRFECWGALDIQNEPMATADPWRGTVQHRTTRRGATSTMTPLHRLLDRPRAPAQAARAATPSLPRANCRAVSTFARRIQPISATPSNLTR